MEMTIELSPTSYATLLENCHSSSAEFAILTAGVLISHSNGERIMEISCETDDAEKLLALANRCCPEAAQEILRSPDFFQER